MKQNSSAFDKINLYFELKILITPKRAPKARKRVQVRSNATSFTIEKRHKPKPSLRHHVTSIFG